MLSNGLIQKYLPDPLKQYYYPEDVNRPIGSPPNPVKNLTHVAWYTWTITIDWMNSKKGDAIAIFVGALLFGFGVFIYIQVPAYPLAGYLLMSSGGLLMLLGAVDIVRRVQMHYLMKNQQKNAFKILDHTEVE